MISLVDAYCICPQIRDVVSQSLSACELDLVEALLVSSDTLLEILVCGFGIGLKPSVGEKGIRWYVAQVLLKLERVTVKEPHYVHGLRSTIHGYRCVTFRVLLGSRRGDATAW